MRTIVTLALLSLVTACYHPLEIVGQGDIESSTGTNDCTLEEQPCSNRVSGDYKVTYSAIPREGWFFLGWEGCGKQYPDCSFNVSGSVVDDYAMETMPPLRAVFSDEFPPIQFTPVVRLSDINTAATGNIWDWAQNGSTLYAAGSADGIYVFDITDPEAPIQAATVKFMTPEGDPIIMPVTDVIVAGGYLFACGRTIQWTDSNQTGIVAVYDISEPLAPVWLDSYQPPDMFQKYRSPDADGEAPWEPGAVANNWYQGMATDGSYLYVASQRFGATVFDWSALPEGKLTVRDTYDWFDLLDDFDLYEGFHTGPDNSAVLEDDTKNWSVNEHVPRYSTGRRVTNMEPAKRFLMVATGNDATTVSGYLSSTGTLDWDAGDRYIINHPTFGWETSRVTFARGWLFFATHGDGVIALRTRAGRLYSPQVYGSYLARRIPPNEGYLQLRSRDVVTDGTYIFAANNVSKMGEEDAPERGVLMMEISNPARRQNSDWFNAPIGWADNMVWDGAGDQPHLGLFQHGDYVYIGNGKGIAVFDVSNRAAPFYIGTHGKVAAPLTSNIYAPYVFEKNGKTYIYYGNATEANQKHNLYVEELSFPQ